MKRATLIGFLLLGLVRAAWASSVMPRFASIEHHALHGETWAEMALAVRFSSGTGGQKDYFEAAALYALAARQGMACPVCLRTAKHHLTGRQKLVVWQIEHGELDTPLSR